MLGRFFVITGSGSYPDSQCRDSGDDSGMDNRENERSDSSERNSSDSDSSISDNSDSDSSGSDSSGSDTSDKNRSDEDSSDSDSSDSDSSYIYSIDNISSDEESKGMFTNYVIGQREGGWMLKSANEGERWGLANTAIG